jgi:hypothetical protein
MSERDESGALPSMFYRDPAEAVDEIRKLRDIAKKQAARLRRNKSLRIQAMVKQVMKNGGDKHGKR